MAQRRGAPSSTASATRESMGYETESPTESKLLESDTGRKSVIFSHYLPHDVVAAILARLPAKTLVKFTCVSKSWNSLIQEEDPYLSAQYRSLKKPGFVRLSCTPPLSDNYTLSYTYASKTHNMDFNLPRQRYFMTNSCDGLLGVYGCDSFYIANPSIMKLSAALPKGSPHVMPMAIVLPRAAIGFEASAGEYKVVRMFDRGYKNHSLVSIGCEVFSFGGNKHHSWRLIDDPPLLHCMREPLPFVLNGAIYWTLEPTTFKKFKRSKLTKPEVALSFNLREEKFSAILHPEGFLMHRKSRTVTLGGFLCVADTYLEKMTIWILKDQVNDKWVKQYNIDLSKIYGQPPKHSSVYSLLPLAIDDGRIVLYYGFGDVEERYDLLTMSFVKHDTIGSATFVFIAPYTESIVWPWS